MIRVLVVDDQAFARRGLTVLLEEQPDIEVLGEATSGPAAVELARELRPDVVLMDVRMPGGDGIAAARVLAAGPRSIPVVLMTTFDLDDYLFAGLEAGVAGFLLKTATLEEITEAVRAADRGDALVSPELTRRIIREFGRRRVIGGSTAAHDLLSPRERDVVRALSNGHASNADIATELHLVPGTVKTHLTRIMKKTGVRSRAQLVAWAFRNGLVS